MIVIISIIAIYLLSAFLSWNYIRVAHSKDGIWECLNPNQEDFILVLFPLVNTLVSVTWIFKHPKQTSNRIDYNKFFKIKK